jgi:hypothetical protein
MKKYCYTFLIPFVLLILISSFVSEKGKIFPSLKGENLDGKIITIPNDTKGKYSLIGLASSQKAQDDLKTWLQPIYETFIAKSSKPSLFEDTYDVHLYLVLMFTGSNEGMIGPAKKKMQQELDPELKPHVLMYKGDVTTYKQELQMTDKDKPYFFLLDEQGNVVHTISGAYSEAKMEKLEEFLSEE